MVVLPNRRGSYVFVDCRRDNVRQCPYAQASSCWYQLVPVRLGSPQWTDLLQTNHSPQLVEPLQACAEAVLDSLESNLHEVPLLEGSTRNIRNNWRRRCNAVLRELEEARNGQMFTVRSMESWLQTLDMTDVWCHLNLPWAEFVRDKAHTPLITLKPNNSNLVSQNKFHFLALMRRILHQNIVYDILSGPIVAHMVCVVGQEMTKGVRLWGDFTALKQSGNAARFCPMCQTHLPTVGGSLPINL